MSADGAQSPEAQLPPFSERLSKLKPSRELLEYYRHKVADYDKEYHLMVEKLDKYKHVYEEVHKNQWEIQQREEEISQLQLALSDMQVYLFQEREHILRLYAENNRLKIKELQDRKKVQYLLTLNPPASQEATYFLRKSSRVVVEQHVSEKVQAQKKTDPAPPDHQAKGTTNKLVSRKDEESGSSDETDKESLLLTVESLKAQLEEQTKLCKEQVDALLEDRNVRRKEVEALQKRNTEKIASLTNQLQRIQGLLYESTKDFLELQYSQRKKEREWISEKEMFLQQMEKLREQLMTRKEDSLLDFSGIDLGPSDTGSNQRHLPQIQLQLRQMEQLADNYRSQCMHLENELSHVREEYEASKGLFKERTDKLTKRLGLMNARYEEIEKRRALEVEGYKNDIKLLRQRLKELEKQLYRLTLTLGDHQDTQMLSQLKQTAVRSKRLVEDLQHLKSKVYTIEKDFRHIHDH